MMSKWTKKKLRKKAGRGEGDKETLTSNQQKSQTYEISLGHKITEALNIPERGIIPKNDSDTSSTQSDTPTLEGEKTTTMKNGAWDNGSVLPKKTPNPSIKNGTSNNVSGLPKKALAPLPGEKTDTVNNGAWGNVSVLPKKTPNPSIKNGASNNDSGLPKKAPTPLEGERISMRNEAWNNSNVLPKKTLAPLEEEKTTTMNNGAWGNGSELPKKPFISSEEQKTTQLRSKTEIVKLKSYYPYIAAYPPELDADQLIESYEYPDGFIFELKIRQYLEAFHGFKGLQRVIVKENKEEEYAKYVQDVESRFVKPDKKPPGVICEIDGHYLLPKLQSFQEWNPAIFTKLATIRSDNFLKLNDSIRLWIEAKTTLFPDQEKEPEENIKDVPEKLAQTVLSFYTWVEHEHDTLDRTQVVFVVRNVPQKDFYHNHVRNFTEKLQESFLAISKNFSYDLTVISCNEAALDRALNKREIRKKDQKIEELDRKNIKLENDSNSKDNQIDALINIIKSNGIRLEGLKGFNSDILKKFLEKPSQK